MINSFNSGIRVQKEKSAELSVAFIGKELFYSNQTLRSVESEFGVLALRYDSLESLCSQKDARARAECIIVVDQMMLDNLLTHAADYMQQATSGCLAFAYRKESAARFLFEHWNRQQYGDIGYLPMNVAPDAWRAILRLLMHEELHLPSFLADCLAQPPAPSSEPSVIQEADPSKMSLFSKLTRREKQVLKLVSQGQSNKLIAAKLGITEHTVKLHLHNASGKIGVGNRTSAAHFYFEIAPHELSGD